MERARTKLTPEQKIARVREATAAWNRGDIDAFVELFAEDGVFHSQLRKADFRGRAEIRAEVAKQIQELGIKQETHDILANDEHVVALEEFVWQQKGQISRTRVVSVAHMNDQGEVTELWAMYNPEEGPRA